MLPGMKHSKTALGRLEQLFCVFLLWTSSCQQADEHREACDKALYLVSESFV